MKSLTELANIYGTDKGTVGPSPEWPAHNYTAVYESYLGVLRDKPIALLEIGLGVIGVSWDARIVHGRNAGGASMRMWRDFFPHGRIYGVDVNPAPDLDGERLRTFIADQSNLEELSAAVAATGEAAFDVIVDDGSHRPDHQQISLAFLFPYLRPGGLYFIEDLMANGQGDGRTGRMACETVLNTRRILKEFVAQGAFPQPNAFSNSALLQQEVAEIVFHCPRVTDGQTTSTGGEALCVIRKRPV